MKPRNYRIGTSKDGEWVLRASTAWMYFAVPLFGWWSFASAWWFLGLIGSLVVAFLYGRETWRRILGAFFLVGLFMPWGWVVGWAVGFGLTTLIDGMVVQEKRRRQREEIAALEDEGCDGRS